MFFRHFHKGKVTRHFDDTQTRKKEKNLIKILSACICHINYLFNIFHAEEFICALFFSQRLLADSQSLWHFANRCEGGEKMSNVRMGLKVGENGNGCKI